MKKIIGVFVGLIVILGAAVLIGPSFVDWNAYKPEITAAVEEKTGRQLSIDGEIDLQILPAPRLSVATVRLSNREGGTDADMVKLDSLQVHVALGSLLGGSVQISSVTLIRPEISLERFADGSANWEFPALAGAPASTNGPSASASGGGSGPRDEGVDLRLDGAEIIDGSVIFRDAGRGETHRIGDLDARIAASSLNGPFSIVGGATYQGLKADLEVNLGRLDTGRATALTLSMRLPDAGGEFRFDGTVDRDAGPSVVGKMEAKAADLRQTAVALGSALTVPTVLPPAFAKPLEVTAAISGDPTRLAVSDLVIGLGDARLQGEIAGDFKDRPSIEARIALGRLDLEKFGLVPGTSGPETAPAPPASNPETKKPAAFTLPTGVRVKLALSADAIDHGGKTVRQIRLDGGLDQGVIAIDVLTAQLPGGTNATVTGKVYADAGIPRFIGRADIVSDNLRAALNWLDVPLDNVAADRLRKGVFGADIDASTKQVELTNWRVDVDNTRIGGGLSLLLRERPAFGLSLEIDQINLDAYLPAENAPGGEAPKTAPAAQPTGDTDRATRMLASFDANLVIRVKEAQYRNTVVRGAALDATVQSGAIVIRDLSVKDVGGAALKVKGKLAGTVAEPSTDLDVSVSAASAAKLARLVGLEVTETAQKLGGFEFRSKVLGSPESLTLDAGLDIADGRVEAKGVVRPLASPVGLDLALKLAHPRTEALLARFAANPPGRELKLGAGTLAASILTSADDSMKVDATVNLAASNITLKGMVKAFSTVPEIQARVAVDHPDIVNLIRLGVPDFNPARRDMGPLNAGFDVIGGASALRIDALSLKAGAATFAGSGSAVLDGPRPKVAVSLQTDRFDVDPWLPAEAAKPQGAGVAVPVRSAGREWSRERIDLTAMEVVDADLDLRAGIVNYGAYAVDGFALKAALAAGRLTVSEFGGGLFGGRIAGTGRLDGTGVPAGDLALKIDNADIRKAALAISSKGQVSGILNYDTELSTRGVSEYDMVAALSGKGKIRVHDGAVEGIDLPAVSDQLKQLDGALDFLKLAQRAMNGGVTPIDEITGTYTITDGVLRSDDIALTSKAATGKTTAVVNLPTQEIDANSRFWLAEHPNSPPIGVRHVGPLANPRTVLDIEKLQAYVLQRVVQRGVLRQFNGGKTPQAAPTSPPTEGESAKPAPAPAPSLEDLKPRDALKGILKGLLK